METRGETVLCVRTRSEIETISSNPLTLPWGIRSAVRHTSQSEFQSSKRNLHHTSTNITRPSSTSREPAPCETVERARGERAKRTRLLSPSLPLMLRPKSHMYYVVRSPISNLDTTALPCANHETLPTPPPPRYFWRLCLARSWWRRNRRELANAHLHSQRWLRRQFFRW